jgi:hypothetical protein
MPTYALTLWQEQQPLGALTVVEPPKSRVQDLPSGEFPYFLAPERICKSMDIAESIQICETHFAYTKREIQIAQISMDDSFMLSVDGQPYRLTQHALSGLCTILGIPFSFALSIPTALTALNVHALKEIPTQAVIMIVRNDVVVTFLDPMKWAKTEDGVRTKKKPHYLPVTNLSLLQMLEKVWSGEDVDTRITLTDHGMHVSLVNQADTFTLEPVVGDVSRVGIAVTNSETGGPLPVARGYTLRLICTNGATVPTDTKLYRFSNDWRCSWQWRLDIFAKALQCLMQDMQGKCGALQAAYTRMVEAKLNDVQLYNWYRKVQYLSRSIPTSSDQIDRIFGVEAKQREEFFTRVRDRQRAIRSGTSAAIEPPQPTGLIAWEVFNGITEAARDEMYYHRRAGLESLAADVVNAFMPSLN